MLDDGGLEAVDAEGDLEILSDESTEVTDPVAVDDLSGDPGEAVPLDGMPAGADTAAPQREIGRIRLQTVKVSSPDRDDELLEGDILAGDDDLVEIDDLLDDDTSSRTKASTPTSSSIATPRWI